MKSFKLVIGISIVLLTLGFNVPKAEITTSSLSSLFKIERSKDNNQIMYDVNINELGLLDKINPINVYWVRNSEGGTIRPLSWVQKKFAYGLKFLDINDEYATFQFVSYDKMSFVLKKKKDNGFEVFTKHKGNLLKMNRIFIKLNGGTFWFPNITAVEVYAKNLNTGEDVIEIIKP
jgi:hypothetical protein